MLKRGDPHPEDPTKVFYRYRKNSVGEPVEQWSSLKVVEGCRQYARAVYAKHTLREKKRIREYCQKNKEKRRETYLRYSSSKRRRELDRKRYRENPEKFRIHNIQQRYKRKRNATPLQPHHQEALLEVYQLCAELNYAAISAGATEPFQVDHIWPLCHKEFCGLHVPWNLQILTRRENGSKSNKRPDRKE